MSMRLHHFALPVALLLAPLALRAADGADAGEAAAPTEEMSLQRELKTVESNVDGLKEKVFRSKARLMLLEEKVIRGVVSGAKAQISHKNTLGPAYQLQSITYYFDGNPVLQRTDSDGTTLAKEKDLDVFEANIPPGNHTLSVTGVIVGRGSGLFAYLSDYTFRFSDSYSFVANDGKTTRIEAVLFKQGGALADFLQGPAVEFRITGDTGKKDGDKGAPAPSAAEGSK